jgi:hypothetical protein
MESGAVVMALSGETFTTLTVSTSPSEVAKMAESLGTL